MRLAQQFTAGRAFPSVSPDSPVGTTETEPVRLGRPYIVNGRFAAFSRRFWTEQQLALGAARPPSIGCQPVCCDSALNPARCGGTALVAALPTGTRLAPCQAPLCPRQIAGLVSTSVPPGRNPFESAYQRSKVWARRWLPYRHPDRSRPKSPVVRAIISGLLLEATTEPSDPVIAWAICRDLSSSRATSANSGRNEPHGGNFRPGVPSPLDSPADPGRVATVGGSRVPYRFHP